MAKPLRPKRGTTAKNDAFTGLASEITIDTDKHSIRVHDGVTAGGHEILPKAKNDELYATIASLNATNTTATNAQATANNAQATANNALPLSGGTMTGALVFSSSVDTFCRKEDDSGAMHIYGASNLSAGGAMAVYGKDDNLHPGAFLLQTAYQNGSPNVLIGMLDGSLKWCDKEVERVSSSNISDNGYVRYESGLQICCGGYAWDGNDKTVTFPVAFNGVPVAILSPINVNGFPIMTDCNATSMTYFVRPAGASMGNASAGGDVWFIVMGRWK